MMGGPGTLGMDARARGGSTCVRLQPRQVCVAYYFVAGGTCGRGRGGRRLNGDTYISDPAPPRSGLLENH